MAQGLFGGMTDYKHQSLKEIRKDLNKLKELTTYFKKMDEDDIKELVSNSYWKNNVPNNFITIIHYSLRFFETTIEEIKEINKDIKREVREDHINRLNCIGDKASEINIEIGQVWHRKYGKKDYGDENFAIVERIYKDTRDAAVTLLDISNISFRLKDFKGRKRESIIYNGYLIAGIVVAIVAIISLIISLILLNK